VKINAESVESRRGPKSREGLGEAEGSGQAGTGFVFSGMMEGRVEPTERKWK